MGLESKIKKDLLAQGVKLHNSQSIHLAIVNEPYLSYIMKEEKTIESRFTKNCIAPYNKVKEDDIVLMKRAGQLIHSYFIVNSVYYYLNTPELMEELKNKYSVQICANNEFWEARKDKKYITLIGIKEIHNLANPIKAEKKDKRGWVTINNNIYQKIYLIAGNIGSGKTWVSKKLSELLKIDRCSFSSYVKWKCRLLNLPINRKNLNEIGRNAVKESIDEFLYFVFNCAVEKKSEFLIVDGLRHIKVLSEIKKYCNNVSVVFIDSDFNTITDNLKSRGTFNEDTKFYSEEGELPLIKEKADIIVKSSNEIELIKDYITNDISTQLRLF